MRFSTRFESISTRPFKGYISSDFDVDRVALMSSCGVENDPMLNLPGDAIYEFEAVSATEAATLIAAMVRVPDGHRLLQTLDTADDFTGDAFGQEAARAERITKLLEAGPEETRTAYLEFMALE